MSFLEELNKRKTFGIISHPDAGKTTLTEKLLLFGGAIFSGGTVGQDLNNDVRVLAAFLPHDPTFPGTAFGIQHHKKVWPSEILGLDLFGAEVDGQVARRVEVLSILPEPFQTGDQRQHLSQMKICFQGRFITV